MRELRLVIEEKVIPIEFVQLCYILYALQANQGNRTRTAKQLQISLRKLRMKLKDIRAWGIDVDNYQGELLWKLV